VHVELASDKLQYYLELVEDLGLKKELDDKILELEYLPVLP
jgi:hypothetical protein